MLVIGQSLQETTLDETQNPNGFLEVNDERLHRKLNNRMLRIISNMFKPQRLISHFLQENLMNPFKNAIFSKKKIDWSCISTTCKQWIKNPLNMALLLWITCVVLSGAILFLVMTGMLNRILTKKSQRDEWFEANNQILNALFTLMCLYQHPKRFYHLVLLLRWKQEDITILRNLYCKNGNPKPHELFHMMVVIVLLHVNCFAQYALCSLNLGFDRSKRPAVAVGICVSIAIAAPIFAGLYCFVSPLGKEYESDEVHCSTGSRLPSETSFSFASRNNHGLVVIEYAPEWRGGLFDLKQNLSVAYQTLFCGFCTFGRNMKRLHFGNIYVHISTFFLFCMAPFCIFNLAALHIDDENLRRIMGFIGILLSVFGLLYGGYWRIQMRKRFNLPPNNNNKLCCGNQNVSDCMQWLLCCWCSLAQEVRTVEFYDIVEDKFSCKNQNHEMFNSSSLWSSPSLSNKVWSEEKQKNHVMEAPIALRINVEDNVIRRT
ncbi:uncharacterized protein LOC130962251 isoform X1 [Arachis stenosperma]|uniref:uncharacterized protein LOC130962251 isoform X1 n=1 Tax=Arachis stenosperma TaxID=217475 RepID=UPI0025ACCC96|nr:uncharacterized protein LOC130962251 isoform X1 [Arachis stenosperma]XP_057744395.1 uncharacterized protein LOC130962251 isoform X1 [Arachis stenosperma]